MKLPREQFQFRLSEKQIYYEVFVVGLLVVLTFLLLRGAGQIEDESGFLIPAMLAAAGLPAALGFLLAFRCGVIDRLNCRNGQEDFVDFEKIKPAFTPNDNILVRRLEITRRIDRHDDLIPSLEAVRGVGNDYSHVGIESRGKLSAKGDETATKCLLGLALVRRPRLQPQRLKQGLSDGHHVVDEPPAKIPKLFNSHRNKSRRVYERRVWEP